MNSGPNSQAPTASSVDQMFKVPGVQAADPLAFIKSNLRTPVPATQVVAEPQAQQPTTPITDNQRAITEPQAVPQAAPDATPNYEPSLDGAEAEPQKEAAPEAPKVDDLETEFPDLDAKDPKAGNWQKLRSRARAEKEAAEKLKLELETTQKTLEDYKTGKALPDTLQEKENEIARLKQYEEVINVKMTPEYQGKVAELKEVDAELQSVFTDGYGLPPEAVDKFRKAKTLQEQNALITKYFDDTARIQVRNLFDKEKQILKGLEAAEKKPQEFLDKVLREGEAARIAREKEQRTAIQSTFRENWKGAITEIRDQGVFSELIHRPDNKEFNDNVVNPIMQKAAGEAGKLLTMLVEDGLTRVRPEVGKFLARMSLLAHSSAINAATREKLQQDYAELERNTSRMNSIIRPNIGSSTGAQGGTPPRETMTAESAAQKLGQIAANSRPQRK